MCEECFELEKKISHYRGFLTHRFDPLTEERIKQAVRDLEHRKATFEEAHHAA
jgi:hypothetical protein